MQFSADLAPLPTPDQEFLFFFFFFLIFIYLSAASLKVQHTGPLIFLAVQYEGSFVVQAWELLVSAFRI